MKKEFTLVFQKETDSPEVQEEQLSSATTAFSSSASGPLVLSFLNLRGSHDGKWWCWDMQPQQKSSERTMSYSQSSIEHIMNLRFFGLCELHCMAQVLFWRGSENVCELCSVSFCCHSRPCQQVLLKASQLTLKTVVQRELPCFLPLLYTQCIPLLWKHLFSKETWKCLMFSTLSLSMPVSN